MGKIGCSIEGPPWNLALKKLNSVALKNSLDDFCHIEYPFKFTFHFIFHFIFLILRLDEPGRSFDMESIWTQYKIEKARMLYGLKMFFFCVWT